MHNTWSTEEPIDARSVGHCPQTPSNQRWHWQAAGTRRRWRSKRHDVLDEFEVVDVDQRVAHRRHGVTDSGARPGQWADIEGDAQSVHGQAEASR